MKEWLYQVSIIAVGFAIAFLLAFMVGKLFGLFLIY